jgi:hypothetical protein
MLKKSSCPFDIKWNILFLNKAFESSNNWNLANDNLIMTSFRFLIKKVMMRDCRLVMVSLTHEISGGSKYATLH